MGNSESQFSSPGSKGTSCIFPGKPKPGSFRILSGKREVLSPHNWWRTSEAASSYKSRASGRGCLPHHRISQPYISTGGRASHHEPPRPGAVRQASQGRCFRGEGQDHALNVCGTPGRAALWEPTEDRCSPTVLLRGDASLRVEFSNVGSVGVGLALGGGVLQCPATGSCTSEPAPRARKGSSLSSDGSWYDCPWGLGGENSEADNTCSSGRTEYCSASDNIGFPVHSEHRSAGGDNTWSSCHTADCSTGDGTPSLGNTADCSTGDGTPSLGNTADCSTGDGTPSLGNTADCSTGDGTPSLGNTADCSTGDGTPSLGNTADCSTGDGTPSLGNTADCSTGDGTPSLGNTADCSTGDGTWSLSNTADCSTGDGTWSLSNTADCSTGDGTPSLGNTADCSTGDGTRSLGNTADCNTGDGTPSLGNTADCSTGDGTWSLGNTADCSTGDGTRSLGNTADCSTGDGTRSLGNTADCSTGDGTQPSGHTEDMTCLSGNTVTSVPGRALDWHLPTVSSLDPYGGPSVAATTPPYHHFSFGYIPDSAALEEQPGVRGYASCTLPCRRSPPVTDDNAQRSSLKSRMRRISDWTGSLRRKRRKLQEPQTEEAGRCLDEGGDTDSPSQTSAHPWPPTPFPALPVPCFGVSGTPPRPRHPSRDDDLDADAFRRSIYMSFMRELESGPAEDETGAGSSSRSLGSLEQLDLLLEDKERGTLRRAGPLSFKPLIALHRDRKLELVPRRRWRQYWVTLKGCLLLFHDTMGRSSLEQNLPPRHTLSVEDSMVQPVPEHPRKENVFCLSCACGDVYLFQASSQTDLENWVTAIHSAGASLLAKRHGKEDTVRLLRSQTRGLLQKIDMDSKMKKMAELQLSVISDQKNRRAIETQIHQWEQNLERFSMELFRLRCYLASLQGGELPNPKGLLAATSRPSKMALSRLGVFSVSSFHALVCSRDDAAFRKRSRSSRSRRGLLTSLKGLDTLSRRARDSPEASQWLDNSDHRDSIAPPEGSILNSSPGTNSCVCFPDNQAIQVSLKQDHCVADVLALACQLKGLDLRAHCLRLCKGAGRDAEFSTPASGDLVRDLRYDKMEVLPLDIFALHMSRPDSAVDFGFAVTGHVDELGHSRIFVCEVLPGGLAFAEGLKSGDEILALSGTGVSTLDLGLMQTVFDKPTLSLVLRREQGTIPEVLPRYPCPSTPSANQPQSLDNIMKLHNGALSSQDVFRVPDTPENGRPHPPMGNGTPPDMKSVETACTSSSAPKGGSGGLADSRADLRQPPCPRHPSAPRKLCKVVQELVDTEKNYVKDLGCLFEIYLKPLQSETFLSRDEMESLFGSLPEMLDFQRVFLQTLEDHIASSPDFSTMETPVQFKKLLISLGGSFLYYADHFKLYSGFCANHIKVQKVLERAKTDRAFKDFLEARNPTKQHSSTLESYLIKPVQRVLKYPLLLRELVSLTDTDSEEHDHLTGALKAMETVASHINEMQKIYEDYGAVFDQLVSEQRGTEKEVTEISMGEFLMHSSAVWLNPFPSLGRLRKAPELTLFVFMKAIILVYRESCKLKKKMTAARSTYSHAGLDPVKFRWLIPLSALQVRLGTAEGTQAKCIWELVHTKSELEGRPETRFQLGSRVLDPKANIVKVIHALLRDSTKRNVPAERGVLERLVSERGAGANTVTADRERVSSRASWLCRQWGLPDSDQGTLTRGTHPERGSPEHARNPPRHSGPLADEDELCGSVMETQFQRLRIAVETSSPVKQGPRVHPGATEMDVLEGQSNTVCAPYLPMRRKNSDQGDNSTVSLDLDSLLQREFSVQSLGSAVNEDFFYEKTDSADNTVPTS